MFVPHFSSIAVPSGCFGFNCHWWLRKRPTNAFVLNFLLFKFQLELLVTYKELVSPGYGIKKHGCGSGHYCNIMAEILLEWQ